MIRTFVFKAASVATLSLATAAFAGAQAPVNVLNIVGNAQLSSTAPSAPLNIDFLAPFPGTMAGVGQPGQVLATFGTGLFSGVSGLGLLQDLQISNAGVTTVNPASATSTFMTIGGYTFALTSAPAASSGNYANFGPIALDDTPTGASATFGVLGTVTGPGFAPGTTFRGIFSTDFVGQSAQSVFNAINTGSSTPIVSFRASFTAPASTVPEPSTYALLATGIGALGLVARRRRTNA